MNKKNRLHLIVEKRWRASIFFRLSIFNLQVCRHSKIPFFSVFTETALDVVSSSFVLFFYPKQR